MVLFNLSLGVKVGSNFFEEDEFKSERNSVTEVRARLLQCRNPALQPLYCGQSPQAEVQRKHHNIQIMKY